MPAAIAEVECLNLGQVAALINIEPCLYKGLTTTELTNFSLVLFIFWFIALYFVIYIKSGVIMLAIISLPLALVFSIITIIVLAEVMQKIKRNRPEGYYLLRLNVLLKKYGLVNNHLIVNSYYWSV